MEDERDFEWCLIGNIIDKHFFGDNMEIRRGNKQFRPNAKVYIFPEFGGMGHENIGVIGKPRKQNRLIEIIIDSGKIKNIRIEKIYSPWLKEKIKKNFYYQIWKRENLEKNEVEEIQKFADFLNTLSKEIIE